MKAKKSDFPLLMQADITYLDSAATSQKPQQVIDAVVNAYIAYNANPGRGIYALAEAATEQYELARKAVASFVHAKDKEIIFVRGATEGINYIATGWALHQVTEGDSILLSELEHHANLLPWQRVAQQTGCELRFIPVRPHDGMLEMDTLDSLLDDSTKLVAITQSANAIGTSVDLTPIIARAKKMGARVLVDACQSVPHEPINLKKMGCDFLAFSGHKMLGPTGIGVLYINASAQHEVQPLCLGGGTVKEVTWHKSILADAPQRFEAGTASLAQAIGLRAAIEYLQQNVPFDELKKHEAALCTQLIDALHEMPRVKIYGPIEQLKKEGHLVTFTIDGMHAHDAAAYLDQKGIAVRAGLFCAQPLGHRMGYTDAIRASFYCYTSPDDVAKLIEALRSLLH
jgi:cysteine desulfurase/selenocysteine lyase